MKPRSPIARISQKKLKALGGLYPSSTAKRSSKQIKKVNPKAKAKRVRGYRKMLSGKEYKAARAEAFKRAGDRCECETSVVMTWTGGPEPGREYLQRCTEILNLHAHHLRYPKSRPLSSDDLKILCRLHHEQAEGLKPHKTRMF